MYLILSDGRVFEGKSFGHVGKTTGKLVFNTGMANYIETLTDPSYFGQIVVQTFPLSGNYGVISEDFESDFIQVKAYIVKEWCQEPSNFRNEGSLDAFLKSHRIPGLHGVDTRALTKAIRDHGSVNAMISDRPNLTPEEWQELKSYELADAVKNVSTEHCISYPGNNPVYSVGLLDLGTPYSLIKSLINAGCSVELMPHTSSADDILSHKFDGLVLSSGPGDPAENTQIISELKKLSGHKLPTLGVGLGHQLLALSHGATSKIFGHGHHGSNQPIREVATGRVSISSQNHNYIVEMDKLPSTAMPLYINCNDGTCEGLVYPEHNAISVQFTLNPYNPDDSTHVLNKFLTMMGDDRDALK